MKSPSPLCRVRIAGFPPTHWRITRASCRTSSGLLSGSRAYCKRAFLPPKIRRRMLLPTSQRGAGGAGEHEVAGAAECSAVDASRVDGVLGVNAGACLERRRIQRRALADSLIQASQQISNLNKEGMPGILSSIGLLVT